MTRPSSGERLAYTIAFHWAQSRDGAPLTLAAIMDRARVQRLNGWLKSVAAYRGPCDAFVAGAWAGNAALRVPVEVRPLLPVPVVVIRGEPEGSLERVLQASVDAVRARAR